MRYKVGDKVRIKSFDWYNENKDNYGAIYAGNGFGFWKNMARHCGEIMKITIVKVDPEDSNKGYYFMENSEERWTDEMIEGLVEEETKFGTASNPLEPKSNANCLTRERVDRLATKIDEELSSENQNVWELPDGYQFIDENGNVINAIKIALEKKKPKYPITYEECCKIIGDVRAACWSGYKCDILGYLNKLLICRDAYWKLYGEEKGLEKSWCPTDSDYITGRYCIFVCEEKIICNTPAQDCILTFPTDEMRDAFYEAFKDLIERCKELL